MRLKAVPEEAISFAAKNPLLLVGVAGIAVVGVVYLRGHQAIAPEADVAASTAQPVYGSYGFAPLSTGGIVSSPTVGMGGGGIIDSISNSSALQAIQDAKDKAAADQAQKNFDSDLTLKQQMFDFEVKKSDQSNSLAWAQLNANLAVAAMNADIAYQGIQASNYQTSTALATSFLMSGKSVAMGSVVAPDGSVTQFGLTAYTPDGSKKGKETNRYLQVLQQSGFAGFVSGITAPQPAKVPAPAIAAAPRSLYGDTYVAQSGIGTSAASSYAVGPTAAPVQSGGSAIAEAVNASSRYDRLPSYKRELLRDSYDLA